MAQYVVRLAKNAAILVLFVLAAVLGSASGIIFAFGGDLPRISALDDYAPSTITRVYGAKGDVVGEFAIQRRTVIKYADISPTLRNAILAAEDDAFFQHFGLSIPHIMMAAVKDVVQRRKAGGASTLTQQLTRKLFLNDEKTWSRKVKEALLAVQIEKRYTKEEIFTLYCNQMYFGHGVYGVEAASRLYFSKSAKDLNLEEAALIAGILQGNVRQSPYVNMDAALRRRNYTLDRMAEVGFATRQEVEEAKKRPVLVKGDPSLQSATIAPGTVRSPSTTSSPRSSPTSMRRRSGCAPATFISPSTRRASRGRGRPIPRSSCTAAISSRRSCCRWIRRPTPRPPRSINRRSSRGPSSPSTIAPGRSR